MRNSEKNERAESGGCWRLCLALTAITGGASGCIYGLWKAELVPINVLVVLTIVAVFFVLAIAFILAMDRRAQKKLMKLHQMSHAQRGQLSLSRQKNHNSFSK